MSWRKYLELSLALVIFAATACTRETRPTTPQLEQQESAPVAGHPLERLARVYLEARSIVRETRNSVDVVNASLSLTESRIVFGTVERIEALLSAAQRDASATAPAEHFYELADTVSALRRRLAELQELIEVELEGEETQEALFDSLEHIAEAADVLRWSFDTAAEATEVSEMLSPSARTCLVFRLHAFDDMHGLLEALEENRSELQWELEGLVDLPPTEQNEARRIEDTLTLILRYTEGTRRIINLMADPEAPLSSSLGLLNELAALPPLADIDMEGVVERTRTAFERCEDSQL